AAPATSAVCSAGFHFRLNLPSQCTSNLNGISALLQPDDLAAVQGPNMSKSGGELLPGSLRPAGVTSQDYDAVAGLEELRTQGDEALEGLEESAKEVAEHLVEANVDTAVRKAFDDFPADVRCQHLPDDVGVTAGFVEPTDDGYMRGIGHQSLLKFGSPPHHASHKRPTALAHLPRRERARVPESVLVAAARCSA